MKNKIRQWWRTYKLFKEIGINHAFRASLDRNFCKMVMED